MRKLLYLTLGAALLSAPAAFAQDNTQPSPQPGPPASDMQAPAPGATDPQAAPGQGVDTTQYQNMYPNQAPNAAQPDQGQPMAPPPGATTAPGPGPAPQPDFDANQGSRLYATEGEYNGQQVQIISNAPVPDTPATRAQFRPLSHAGRRTAPAGN